MNRRPQSGTNTQESLLWEPGTDSPSASSPVQIDSRIMMIDDLRFSRAPQQVCSRLRRVYFRRFTHTQKRKKSMLRCSTLMSQPKHLNLRCFSNAEPSADVRAQLKRLLPAGLPVPTVSWFLRWSHLAVAKWLFLLIWRCSLSHKYCATCSR